MCNRPQRRTRPGLFTAGPSGSLCPHLSAFTHVWRLVPRVTQCKYKRIGCPWQGPFHELPGHEMECSHPTKTGTELMGILGEMDQNHRRDMQLYNGIFSLLCYEKIGFTGSLTRTRLSPVDPIPVSRFSPSPHLLPPLPPFCPSSQRCSSGRIARTTSSPACTTKRRASPCSTRPGC